METEYKVILVVVVVGVILGAYFGFPYLSSKFFKPLSILSVSSIAVKPLGSENPTTKEWTGSFWVITMTADMTDSVATYVFDENEASKGTQNVGDKTLVPKAKIEIQIDPQQPYYIKQLEIKSVEVAPKAYGAYLGKIVPNIGKTSDTVDRVMSGHYEWAVDARWEKFTPFTITVLKDGVKVGEATAVNTEGGSKEISIQTNEGSILVNNLGMLAGRYVEAPLSGDVLYFADNQIFQADTLSRTLIKSPFPTDTKAGSGVGSVALDTYAVYWYGQGYWKDDGTPTPYDVGFKIPPVSMLDPSKYGGWKGDDNTLNYVRKPIQPIVMDKSKLPSDKKGFMSLVEFLSSKGVTKKSANYGAGDGFKRQDDKFQVNVPFSALNEGSNLFTILIPTELADTVVWQPSVSDVKIAEWNLPTELGDRYDGWIKFEQQGSVRSTARVTLTFEPATMPITVTPNQFDITVDPESTKMQQISILNSGSQKEQDVTFKITVRDTFGTVTDEKTVTIKLLTKGVGTTVLTVYTIDADTLEKVSGVFITVGWDTQSKGAYTSAGSTTFDMGSITGSVSVSSAETTTYKSASDSKQLTAGSNSITLKLIKQGAVEKSWLDQYWWLLLLVGIIVIVVVIVILWLRRE